jgi:oxalate decarboxylase
MSLLSRRKVLAFGAAGGVAAAATAAHAASFGNPDAPPQGAVNAKFGLSDPGPQNPALASQFPQTQNPPATDVGDLPQFWSSFNIAHKRACRSRSSNRFP